MIPQEMRQRGHIPLRTAALWLGVVAALPGFGQSRIWGLLLDPSGESVPNATVQLKPAGVPTRSDDQGRYEILTGPGAYELTYRAAGFAARSRRVAVSAGEAARIDLSFDALAPQSSSIVIAAKTM